MADLSLSRQPVHLADSAGNIASVINSAPTTDYGLVVRNIPSGTQNVSLTGTNVVDTELPAAAALADGAANPTTPAVGADLSVWNGATWDRLKSIAAAIDSTGTGIPTAGIIGQLDDTATATVTENQFAPIRISTRRALLVEGVSGGTNLNVNVAAATTLTVDTELPAAAALADNTSNPTAPAVGAFLHAFDGTTHDRLRVTDATDGNVALTTTGVLAVGSGPGFSRRFNPTNLATASNSTSAVDVNGAGTAGIEISTTTTGTLTIEATGDGTTWVAPITYDVGGGAFVTGTNLTPTTGKVYLVSVNGMRQVRLRTVTTLGATVAHVITLSLGDVINITPVVAGTSAVNLTQVGGAAIAIGQTTMSASLPVTIASNQSALAVDSELPAAAALANGTSNPTVPGVGSFLMGWNTATWDRVAVANSGRLQVDVITGASGLVASELPTGYNNLIVYGSTSGTASAGTASVVTNTPANTKLFYVQHIVVAASGATKWQVKFGATVLATGFIPQAVLTEKIRFNPPLQGTGDGATALTIDVTNREASAMDLYARLGGIVLA